MVYDNIFFEFHLILMKATGEQLAIKEAAEKGLSFKVLAYAGSGKTKTMLAACRVISANNTKNGKDGKGLFLAFNRAIADEAAMNLRKFSINAEAKTWHKLAISSIQHQFNSKLNNLSNANKDLIALMDSLGTIPSLNIKIERNEKDIKLKKQTNYVSARALKYMICAAIEDYCSSADTEIKTIHFENSRPDWIEPLYFHREIVQKYLLPIAKKAWEAICDPDNQKFQLTFGHALKIYQLSRPDLSCLYSYLIVDEAQDTDRVALEIINSQDMNKIQIIVVGDSFQQIYQWRGAQDALRNISIPLEFYLTKSFRFGTELADFATSILKLHFTNKAISPIIGNETIKTSITQCKNKYHNYDELNAIITRTNSGAFEVLMKLKEDFPHLNISLNIDLRSINKFVDAYERLSTFKPQHSDSPLAIFSSIGELEEYLDHANLDSEISTPYNLIKLFGLLKIKNTLSQIKNHTYSSCLCITTAHKSKGLEYDNVLIYNDFNDFIFKSKNTDKVNKDDMQYIFQPKTDEEARLFYVAVTRAKKKLILENLHSYINNLSSSLEKQL